MGSLEVSSARNERVDRIAHTVHCGGSGFEEGFDKTVRELRRPFGFTATAVKLQETEGIS